jgi:beta-galactosidase
MNRTAIYRLQAGEQPRLIHGGDYNPDQWLHDPEVLEDDLRLMKLAHINSASVGIFAWAALEPEEGRFTFEWLDACIQRLHDAGVTVMLATPTGARPAWMSATYPEVLRVQPNRVRNLHGTRHNHCYTSPVYREKTQIINTKLAERYVSHPAVVLWHLSNEYGGECHCPLCQDAFRAWLMARYEDDLDALNRAWWTGFWSHTYTSWSQVESPAPHGEHCVHGHNLDWKRFVTHQTRDFIRHEVSALRAVDTSIPVTTNLMGFYPVLNYVELARDIDVVSWDSYPAWHGRGSLPEPRGDWDPAGDDARLATRVGMAHDLNRSLGMGRPFLLMESVTSATNWASVAKLKRPGMHLLSSLQAVAHGSDSVQYFQFRKGRGSSEKFHGAVVDHVGHEHTRVFQDVADVGAALEALSAVAGTTVPAQAAVMVDWENRWAIDDAQGPRNDNRTAYLETCDRHHHALARLSVLTDVVDGTADLLPYTLIAAPMLYMIRPGVAERLTEFVRGGGTLVVTYWSGIVDQHDLCHRGGFPGPLRELLGIWDEEIDALYPGDHLEVVLNEPLVPGGPASFEAGELAALIHTEGAEVLGTYRGQFYSGRPALTVNAVGAGRAYYVASRNEQRFLNELYARVAAHARPRRAFDPAPADGVLATLRSDGRTDYRFLMNFTAELRPAPALEPGEEMIYRSPPPNTGTGRAWPETATEAPAATQLPPYGVQVRTRAAP